MNVGVTLLGVLWVGLFGSFAALMLSIGDDGTGILLAAILGTVGYDVGGLFVGKNAGRQPLSAASTNKTVEGLGGGGGMGFSGEFGRATGREGEWQKGEQWGAGRV